MKSAQAIFRLQVIVLALCMLAIAPGVPRASAQFAQQPKPQQPTTVKLKVSGRDYYGWAMAQSGKQLALLQPDGQLRLLPFAPGQTVQTVSNEFKPLTPDQVAKYLYAEFGRRYEVTTTKHYVVVHPPGDREIWADPFESIHDQFNQRISKMGLTPNPAPFPLVAVVLRSRREFDRYLNNELNMRSTTVGGYYSRLSNRIMTYDPGAKLRTGEDLWLTKDKSVLHETTHQLAFNLGVHNRFSPPPKWLSEGFAMLFEVSTKPIRGGPIARTNPQRSRELRLVWRKREFAGCISKMISDDRLFTTNPEIAYPAAWALTLYLSQTNPKKFSEFLKQDGRRLSFSVSAPDKRRQDFATTFGVDWKRIEQETIKFTGMTRSTRSR